MVQDTKRYLAYICPHCRQSVIVERDLFSLAASTAHIKCPCGKSELTVEFLPSRVRLRVPVRRAAPRCAYPPPLPTTSTTSAANLPF